MGVNHLVRPIFQSTVMHDIPEWGTPTIEWSPPLLRSPPEIHTNGYLCRELGVPGGHMGQQPIFICCPTPVAGWDSERRGFPGGSMRRVPTPAELVLKAKPSGSSQQLNMLIVDLFSNSVIRPSLISVAH